MEAWKDMKFCSILLTLRLIFSAAEAQRPLIEILSCFNDYSSYTACTWSENLDEHHLIKMNLFHKDNRASKLAKMTCSSRIENFQIHWSCRRNQAILGAFLNNTYIFKPEQELEAQLNVSLFEIVQPPPPQELNISVTEGGDFQLAWKAGGGTNRSDWLDKALDFEVSYKQEWETWENSSSVLVSNTAYCLLQHDYLVPGSTYIARVRSKPSQDSGLSGYYSEWSSEVSWETKKGNEAQPKNLRCSFNGLDRLICSWQVRQEIASSVLFSLFYKASPESTEEECSPVQNEELPSASHLLQSCKINVTNPNRLSQYLVTVRPKLEKVMKAMHSIKPEPPYNLSLKMLKSEKEYTLYWEAKKINEIYNIAKMYEITYWKTGKPLESQSQVVENDFPQYTFTSQFLEPATKYRAKVRAKVKGPKYRGPWSEWSEEFEWETESVLPPWVLPLVAPVSIILMLTGIFCGYKYFLRKKKEWEANIPSPPKKFLLLGYFLNAHLPPALQHFSSQSSSGEEEVSYTNVLERQMLFSHPESPGAESENTRSPSVACHNVDILGTPTLSVANAGQCLSQAGLSPLLVCSSNAKVGLAHQIFDLDGPYLRCPPESSLPDVQQDLEVAPLEMRGPSRALQYVELSHSLCSQLLPVGTEKRTALTLSAVLDQEEKQQPLSKEQEVSKSQSASGKLKEEENEDYRPPNPTSTNNCCQNGPLDYIATADLPLTKERGCSLLLPGLASKEDMFTSGKTATTASLLLQPNEGLSSSELCQKKPDAVLSAEGQALAAPSRTSQEVFGDYVMTLPSPPDSAPKEGQAFSTDQSRHDSGFLMFHPDGSSPVFLRQVDEYCFFPGTKPIKEAPKSQKETMVHQLSESKQTATKPHCESKFLGDKVQTNLHMCQDFRVDVPQ